METREHKLLKSHKWTDIHDWLAATNDIEPFMVTSCLKNVLNHSWVHLWVSIFNLK